MAKNHLWHPIRLFLISLLLTPAIAFAASSGGGESANDEAKSLEKVKRRFEQIKEGCSNVSYAKQCVEILNEHAAPFSKTWHDSVSIPFFSSGPFNDFSGLTYEYRYKVVKVKREDLGKYLASKLHAVDGAALDTNWDYLAIRVGLGYQVAAKASDAKFSINFTANALPGTISGDPEENYFEATIAGIAPNSSIDLGKDDCKNISSVKRAIFCAIPSLPSIDQASFKKISDAYIFGFRKALEKIDSYDSKDPESVLYCPQILDARIFGEGGKRNDADPGVSVRVKMDPELVRKLQEQYQSEGCKGKQANIRALYRSGHSTTALGFNDGGADSSDGAVTYVYARNQYFYPKTYCNRREDNSLPSHCSQPDNYSWFTVATNTSTLKTPSILAAFFNATSSSSSISAHVYSQLTVGKILINNAFPFNTALDASAVERFKDVIQTIRLQVDNAAK